MYEKKRATTSPLGCGRSRASTANSLGRMLIVLSVFVLAGCSKSLDLQLEPEVTAYITGESRKTIRLTAQDKAYVVLNRWLQENASDWYPTSGRYPGGVYIKSGVDGIQVTDALVILYSAEHAEPRAMYVHKILKDELSEIKNLGR